MKITINEHDRMITRRDEDGRETLTPLYSQEGFKLLSSIWLKQEWNQLHWQSFSWMGFPIWQFPEDLLRLQEVIASLKPDVIIETGLNRGGSAAFFASMCRLLGKGRVISVDIQIPKEVRQTIEKSSFSKCIDLVEGDSAAAVTVETVRRKLKKGETVFVFLDSSHTKTHVLQELNTYAPMVTPGSYIVAADGVMRSLADTPKGRKEWFDDNPAAAAQEFVEKNPEFRIQRPKALFNDPYVVGELTYWPDAWLYRMPKTDGI